MDIKIQRKEKETLKLGNHSFRVTQTQIRPLFGFAGTNEALLI
jgi:hypothetical protein